MNILIVHEIDWIKKVPFEPHHLAELFSLEGHNVFVIDCPEPNLTKFMEGLHDRTIHNFHRLYNNASITIIRPFSLLVKGLNRLSYFLTCKHIIEKTIVEKNIDLILLYGVATNGIQTISIAKKLKIPIIFRALDVAHGLVKIPVVKQLAKRYEKVVIGNANKVLTTTPELSRYVIDMSAEEENVEYFPLGINSIDFKPLLKDAQFAKSIGINDNDSVIVFIGTIYDFAGLDNMVSKFQILKDALKNVKFLIVGGGPYFDKLKSLIVNKKLESNVILTGFKPQNELPKYIALADICVNPFLVNYVTDRIIPTKILEYLACSKPVLSTPLKGTKELLPNEDFGIVYSTYDNFVLTLSDLLKNKSKLYELGGKGYDYVKKNHDWSILSKKLLDIFENLLP